MLSCAEDITRFWRVFGSMSEPHLCFFLMTSMLMTACSAPQTMCEVASDRILQCTGETIPAIDSCDTDAAAQSELIIAASCEELTAFRPEGKTDGALCDWFAISCKNDEAIFDGTACETDEECGGDNYCIESHCFTGVASDDFADTLDQLTRSDETSGNLVTDLVDNESAWQARVDLFNSAEHSIHIAAFYLYDDAIGREVLELCRQAVARGVEVRILLDEVFMRFSRYLDFIREFHDAGVEVMLFNPFLGWGSALEGVTLNNRLHQKVFVVDGKVAIQGGRNWAEHYFAKDEWRDSDVMVIGPAVHDLQRLFLEGWDEANRLESAAGCFQELNCESTPLAERQEYYPAPEDVGESTTRILFSRPWEAGTPVGFLLYLSAIRSAKSEILITNAYLIPPRRLRRHLKNAVQRGVRVRIITNGLESSDPKLTWYGAANYYQELMDAGIEVHEWQGEQTMHAKSMTVDGKLHIVGSWNIDPRSALLNSESLVVSRDDDAAAAAQAQFEEDLLKTAPASTEFSATQITKIALHRFIEPWL